MSGKSESVTAKGRVVRRVFRVVGTVLAVLFFILAVLCLVAAFSAKNGDGGMTVFGMQMRVVLSSSMEGTEENDFAIKSVPYRSMVFIAVKPEEGTAEENEWYEKLEIGDVLTFVYYFDRSQPYVSDESGAQQTVTHRITNIQKKPDGGYRITLKGDAVEEGNTQTVDTTADAFNRVIGKVTGYSRLLGYAVTAVRTPLGVILIIILPCTIIMIAEVVRIVVTVRSAKRTRVDEERKAREEEIAALKKQLAALQNADRPPAPPSDDGSGKDRTEGEKYG